MEPSFLHFLNEAPEFLYVFVRFFAIVLTCRILSRKTPNLEIVIHYLYPIGIHVRIWKIARKDQNKLQNNDCIMRIDNNLNAIKAMLRQAESSEKICFVKNYPFKPIYGSKEAKSWYKRNLSGFWYANHEKFNY